MPRFLTLATIVLALLLGLTACEETVDPFVETDQNYTMFGTLDLGRDTQYVRVIPIRESLEADAAEPLDITFTSEDMNLGEVVEWRDSIVTFPGGELGHVFYAPMRIRAGHTYRIEITPDGESAVTSAETISPMVPTAHVQPEEVSGGAFGVATATQTVFWQGIRWRPFDITQFYRFMITPSGQFTDVPLPYEPPNEAASDMLWAVNLNLRNDKRTLDTLISTRDMPLAGLGMQVTMLDPAFDPPGGAFNPEVLVQPGTMSNVTNGFGFVGAVGRFSVEWLLERENVDRLGFVTMEEMYFSSEPPAVEVLPFPWSAMPE